MQVGEEISVPAAETQASARIDERTRPERRFFGVFTRKLRWGLEWWAWLLLLGFICLTATALIKTTYPFLAVTNRLNADVLVVEGWLQYFAVDAAAKEFKTGSYSHIYTTGGPTRGSGGYTWDADTTASIGAGELRKRGLNTVQMVPSHLIGRDRTYYSAVTLRDWFRDHHVNVTRLNVVTENVHARRTRLLFQKAFGKEVEVGIIAVPNPDYDPNHWWQSSDGFRDVVSEAIAYLYARFLFTPDEPR